MQENVQQMQESTQTAVPEGFGGQGTVRPVDVAHSPARLAANGLRYASFGETGLDPAELERMVLAVPASIAAALDRKTWYFVPLALTEGRSEPGLHRAGHEETIIAPAYTVDLAEFAICHRNVDIPSIDHQPATEGVFISTRLLSDRFALAFEFFINASHAFVDHAGVPASFSDLVWNQALADIRGETSQDAWECRAGALSVAAGSAMENKPRVDEKAKLEYLEAAFSDAVAIYLLSLALDFDYSELREREYPLLAPTALAERLRLVAKLFPPAPPYEFSIRYRRRA
jgi:hypothetical protein